MKLWERLQRGMEDGFEAALTTVHNITERAGEGIELTRLRREKSRLEIQLTRLLAALGNTVFEKISEERLDDISEKLGIQEKLVELASYEARMVEIDRKLGKELDTKEKKKGEETEKKK
jgi:hypothetical protein